MVSEMMESKRGHAAHLIGTRLVTRSHLFARTLQRCSLLAGIRRLRS